MLSALHLICACFSLLILVALKVSSALQSRERAWEKIQEEVPTTWEALFTQFHEVEGSRPPQHAAQRHWTDHCADSGKESDSTSYGYLKPRQPAGQRQQPIRCAAGVQPLCSKKLCGSNLSDCASSSDGTQFVLLGSFVY